MSLELSSQWLQLPSKASLQFLFPASSPSRPFLAREGSASLLYESGRIFIVKARLRFMVSVPLFFYKQSLLRKSFISSYREALKSENLVRRTSPSFSNEANRTCFQLRYQLLTTSERKEEKALKY